MNEDPIIKLNKDLKDASKLMSLQEAKFLVDAYYITQNNRIRVDGQIRSMANSEPTHLLHWLSDVTWPLEENIKKSLGIFASQYAVGQWLQGICGIGPVMSAGFLAILDVRDRHTAGCFWRFAGIDPTLKWEKGTKRPWNAGLKVLCYKAGESFVKVQNNKKDFYGKLYKEKKQKEIENNEKGKFKEFAIERASRFAKNTLAYSKYIEGKLPDNHIHSRARRYTVTLFLSHLHTVMYRDYYQKDPPVPYVFSDNYSQKELHTHYIPPPEIEVKGGKSLKDLYGE